MYDYLSLLHLFGISICRGFYSIFIIELPCWRGRRGRREGGRGGRRGRGGCNRVRSWTTWHLHLEIRYFKIVELDFIYVLLLLPLLLLLSNSNTHVTFTNRQIDNTHTQIHSGYEANRTHTLTDNTHTLSHSVTHTHSSTHTHTHTHHYPHPVFESSIFVIVAIREERSVIYHLRKKK